MDDDSIKEMNHHINIQRLFMKDTNKNSDNASRQQLFALYRDIGKMVWSSTNDNPLVQHRQHLYTFPLTSRPDKSSMLICRTCLKRNLRLTKPTTYNRLLGQYGSVNDLPSSTNSSIFKIIRNLFLQVKNNNCAMVVPQIHLARYNHHIILQNPVFKKKTNVPDGMIEFGSNAIINGKICKLDNDIRIDMSSSCIIVVKQSDLQKCMKDDNKHQQYNYIGCTSETENANLVILSVVSSRENDQDEFQPTDSDLTLIEKFKKPLFPNTNNASNHFGSTGSTYVVGQGATYRPGEYVGDYATNTNQSMEDSMKYQKIIDKVEITIHNVLNSLLDQASFDIVEEGSSSTLLNIQYVNEVNEMIHRIYDDRPGLIKLSSLKQGENNLYYPSATINVNASTNVFHTENDQGYTLIISLFQKAFIETNFLFRINSKCKVFIPMNYGNSLLFNARLLTHKQQCNNRKGQYHWNLGCYANRRMNQMLYARFHNELSFLLGDIQRLLNTTAYPTVSPTISP